jgi:endonuclease/exonuclease/phosphatase family metal-dependent hydrolase
VTNILTWNIQCGRGVDDRVDLERTAGVIKGMADADIICLQEVSRFDAELDGGQAADQVDVISKSFPGYEAIFGPALDRFNEGMHQRRQFGNLILSRLPVIQVFNHLLPQPIPAEPCKHMPRQALEVVVEVDGGPLRITTTHLEYHCAEQRLAQAGRIRDIQAEILTNLPYALTAPSSGPYAAIARPARSIICGDFNSAPDDTVYQTLTAPIINMPGGYQDAWRWVHKQTPHAPTCGIYDRNQWPEGPHCRDFFFISEDLEDLARDVQVQQETDASDHQPVLLGLSF